MGVKNGKSLFPPSQTMTSASASARREDRRVVDARPHDAAHLEMRLVLLALLERHPGAVEVGERGEALDALAARSP